MSLFCRGVICAASMVLLLLAAATLGSMEIYLAPLSYQDETVTDPQDAPVRHPAADLLKRFDGNVVAGSVTLLDASELAGEAPRTYLEAARVCETLGYPYILYGFVKRTEHSLYAELKLLERDGKNVAAAFISGDDADHYERLIDDLAGKLTGYVKDDLGMAPAPSPRKPARNLVALPMRAGWWTPMGGPWSKAMTGLVSAEMSVRFVPSRPLFVLWARPCFLAMGLDLAYTLGTNQPGVESFFLHGARVRLPVEAFMDLGGGHRIGLGAGPLLEVDALAKAPLYSSAETHGTVAPGVSVSLIYQYVLMPGLTLGLVNTFDAAFYVTPLLSWSPKIGVDLWLDSEGAGR